MWWGVSKGGRMFRDANSATWGLDDGAEHSFSAQWLSADDAIARDRDTGLYGPGRRDVGCRDEGEGGRCFEDLPCCSHA